MFDLDLWPTTLTYSPRLANVKVDSHAKNQGQRSNGQTGERPQTNGRTHTHAHAHRRYQMYYLPCHAVDNQSIQSEPIPVSGIVWLLWAWTWCKQWVWWGTLGLPSDWISLRATPRQVRGRLLSRAAGTRPALELQANIIISIIIIIKEGRWFSIVVASFVA